MNFPVTDTFELGKLLLCCFNRPFSTGSRSNNDRALAAPKESLVWRDFVDKANAVAWHLSPPVQLNKGNHCSAVSNEIVAHHDWLPTFLAMAGDVEIKEKLLKG